MTQDPGKMTEEEAKTKVCKRVPVLATHGEYEGNYVDYPVYCIASACMMWRLDLTREEAENGLFPKNGYCGLGGRP